MVYGLEEAEENTINQLQTVTETINEMSRSYRKKEEIVEDKKQDFIDALEEKIETLKENVLYDDIKHEENGLIDSIYEELEETEKLTKDKAIKLLEDRNEYILGFDDFDTNLKVEKEIEEMVKVINETYKVCILNNMWRQRLNQSKNAMRSQLDRSIKSNIRRCRNASQIKIRNNRYKRRNKG